MQIPHEAVLLRIFIGESDHWEHKPLHEAIVLKARELHLAGATVLRGPMGFGKSSRSHTAKTLRWSLLGRSGCFRFQTAPRANCVPRWTFAARTRLQAGNPRSPPATTTKQENGKSVLTIHRIFCTREDAVEWWIDLTTTDHS